VSYAATSERQNTSLFLKRDEGSGEGKNLFSREKKFFPSPEQSPLIGNIAFYFGQSSIFRIDIMLFV
jgi:hypothetical protein